MPKEESQDLLRFHHPQHVCPGERREDVCLSGPGSLCVPWPHPQANLHLHELRQQEFIYKLIIPVTHVQLGLGCNKELGSGPASKCAHEAGKAVSQDQPHHTRSQEGRWEEWRGNASPPVCLGSNDSRPFPNSGLSPAQRPQMEGLAGSPFLTFTSPNVPGNLDG